jgi:cation diffusion facilitator CzcD-associated flavoprotein CzcO
LPAQTPKQNTNRYAETSVYPYLETNVDARTMEFSQEPISAHRSQRSIGFHGPDTPFRPHEVIRQYVEGLVNRNGYEDLIEYNTTVERATKKDGKWELVLRKSGGVTDYWWTESFDALVVANGHYTVPYFPPIDGLKEFEKKHPGSVEHSKAYRGREKYRGKVSTTFLNREALANIHTSGLW